MFSLYRKVQFFEANQSDLNEICNLVQATFGPHPKAEDIFGKWIREPQYHVTVAKYQGSMIGMAASSINPSPDLPKYECFGNMAVDFLKDQKLGWFLTLAVSPKFRKKSIGWNLAREQAEWLKGQGCSALIGSSWVSGSEDNSDHMFIKAGFKKLGESDDFLRNQLRGTGSVCSACGKTECECKSVLYGSLIK